MEHSIVQFIKSVNRKYGTEALYFPDDNVYSIRFRGRAVQNFNSDKFYQIPKRHRFKMIGDIIKVGLVHNIGEKSLQHQIYLDRSLGKKIR